MQQEAGLNRREYSEKFELASQAERSGEAERFTY